MSKYFDSLIDRVNIHTEEQLKKYSSEDTMENPDKMNKEKTNILVTDYLKGTREKMIKMIGEVQAEALKKLESIKEDVMTDQTAEKIFGKVFANRFFFIIQINSFKEKQDTTEIDNNSAFKLILIETHFYINEPQLLALK